MKSPIPANYICLFLILLLPGACINIEDQEPPPPLYKCNDERGTHPLNTLVFLNKSARTMYIYAKVFDPPLDTCLFTYKGAVSRDADNRQFPLEVPPSYVADVYITNVYIDQTGTPDTLCKDATRNRIIRHLVSLQGAFNAESQKCQIIIKDERDDGYGEN